MQSEASSNFIRCRRSFHLASRISKVNCIWIGSYKYFCDFFRDTGYVATSSAITVIVGFTLFPTKYFTCRIWNKMESSGLMPDATVPWKTELVNHIRTVIYRSHCHMHRSHFQKFLLQQIHQAHRLSLYFIIRFCDKIDCKTQITDGCIIIFYSCDRIGLCLIKIPAIHRRSGRIGYRCRRNSETKVSISSTSSSSNVIFS